MQQCCNSAAISLQKLCGLAFKSAMVLGQNYGSFGAKVRHFWVQSVVVLATGIWWGVENRSIGFGKTINRLYMNRSIVFEKSIIHF